VCKKSITNSQLFVKKNEKMSGPLGGGIFFLLTLYNIESHLPFIYLFVVYADYW